MQKNYNFFGLFLCCCFLVASLTVFAQPPNDECSGAIDISQAFMGNCGDFTFNGPFDITGATAGTNDPPEPGEAENDNTDGPFCPDETDTNLFGDDADAFEQSIWYTWVVPDLNGDGSPVTYSIWTSDGSYGDDCDLNPNNILGGDADTQVAIYEMDNCPDASTGPCDHLAANEDLFQVPPWISGWLALEFTPGQRYYMAVDAWDANEGEFCLTVVICGVECGDDNCAPVETYCDCLGDCAGECPATQIYGISETDDGNFRSADWSGNVLHCSERVLGYTSDNVYLTLSGSDENCVSDGLDLPVQLSIGNITDQDGGMDTIFAPYYWFIELTPEEFAVGSITIDVMAPDGLGNTCSNSVTIDLTALELNCDITCFAGGYDDAYLPPASFNLCEDGTLSLCTNGLEDLTLPCDGPGGYDYYWRVYVQPYGPGTDWNSVSGWIPLGPCPTNIPVSDLFIDVDGSLAPNFEPGSQILAWDNVNYAPGPIPVYIEGAALCVDADGVILDGCFPRNEGDGLTTDINGTNRRVIEVTYYPAGDPACDGGGGCTQNIDLIPGWNLISFDVALNNASVLDVFANPLAGNLEFVTSFIGGAVTFDPNIPFPFNTLQNVGDGYGYWVKVQSAASISVSGPCLADDFLNPLSAGWNLIAYPPDASQSPVDYFADEISAGNLEFVTGFDAGTITFDPNIPFPFNTLQEMVNGFGYWVKVTSASPFAKTADNSTSNLTNIFNFVFGTTNLPVGEQVEILNKASETIAIVDVVEGNYLMTTPIYGDDQTTAAKEYVSIGENLRFSWNNQISDFKTTFKGDYGVEKINLEFDLAKINNNLAVKAYPIPAKDMLNFEITVNEATNLLLKIFDNKGSLVNSIDNSSLPAGKQIINYNVEHLSVGIYTYQLITGNQLNAGKFNVVR